MDMVKGAINSSVYGKARKRKSTQYEEYENSPEGSSEEEEKPKRGVIRSNQASQYSKINTEEISKNSQKKEMMFTEFWNQSLLPNTSINLDVDQAAKSYVTEKIRQK